ncbi:hypothetical protein Q5O12_28645, partial [Klebsiella pneumoniae]|uniref:hypothetical protein n=1 Tax=Klebsiella pneumoniae TaxID=573 RepID=UPI00272F7AEE
EELDQDGLWRASIRIDPGQATTVRALDIEILGEGRSDPALIAWQEAWPLGLDQRLIHGDFEQAWRDLVQLAGQRGY